MFDLLSTIKQLKASSSDCQSISNKFDELNIYIEELNKCAIVHVIALQEKLVYEIFLASAFEIPNNNLIFSSSDPSMRACVFIVT